jgi:predicted secreted protein
MLENGGTMNASAAIEEISMAPGDGCISLSETPMSGHRWSLVDVPREVTVLGDEFILNSSDADGPPKIGEGGVRTYRIHVDTPGVYNLRFVRKRAWEARPVEERIIRLNVA